MLNKELWVRKKIGRGRGGGGVKIVILSTHSLLHKSLTTKQATSKKKKKKKERKNDISKQHIKQAIGQGKLRKITKCLLTRFL